VIHSDPTSALQSTRARLDSASYTGPCRIRLGLYPSRLATPIRPCLPGPFSKPFSGLGRTGAPCESHIMHASERAPRSRSPDGSSRREPSFPPASRHWDVWILRWVQPCRLSLFGCCASISRNNKRPGASSAALPLETSSARPHFPPCETGRQTSRGWNAARHDWLRRGPRQRKLQGATV